MVLIQGFSDQAILICGVIAIAGVNKIYEGGLQKLFEDLRGGAVNTAPDMEIHKVFSAPIETEQQRIIKSIVQTQNELYIEDSKTSPTDLEIKSNFLARKKMEDIAKMLKEVKSTGGQR